MKMSKEDRDTYVSLHTNKTIKQLAIETGWADSTIKACRRRLGLSKAHPKELEIIELAKEGLGPYEIAEVIDVRGDIAGDILRKHGLENYRFMKSIIEKYPTLDFSKSKYINTKTAIEFKCKSCGTLTSKRPNDLVTNKYTCPCSRKSRRKEDRKEDRTEYLKSLDILELIEEDVSPKELNSLGVSEESLEAIRISKHLDSFIALRDLRNIPLIRGVFGELVVGISTKINEVGRFYSRYSKYLAKDWELLSTDFPRYYLRCRACGHEDSCSQRTRKIRKEHALRCKSCNPVEFPKYLQAGEFEVYLMKTEVPDVYKVGYTSNMFRRKYDICTQTGIRIKEVLGSSLGLSEDSARALESYLLEKHIKELWEHRGHAEFRKLSENQVQDVLKILRVSKNHLT